MKQLIIINQPFPFKTGGTEVKLANQVRQLKKKGVEVTIFASKSEKKKSFFTDLKVDIRNIGLEHKTYNGFLPFKLIYWFMVQFSFIVGAIWYSRWIIFDIIEVKDPYSGIAGVFAKWFSDKPLILETAGAFGPKMRKLYVMKYGKFVAGILYFFMNSIEKFVYTRCDAIITEDNISKRLKELGFKGLYKRIPNGVDTSEFKKKFVSKRKKVILYVGRLDKEKNVMFIVDNFDKIKERISNAILVIVGSGTEKLPIKKDVFYEGFKTNTIDYYNIADVLVMASHYESLPCVVLEAMACEVPVVCTNVGMMSEVIDNRFLYNLKDGTFVSKVVKAIKNKDRLGKNALKTIKEKFDWNELINRYLEVYNKIFYQQDVDKGWLEVAEGD